MKLSYIANHIAEQEQPEKRARRLRSLLRARRQRARRERVEPRTPDVVDAGGCRIGTRIVPAAGGGDRRITVTRC